MPEPLRNAGDPCQEVIWGQQELIEDPGDPVEHAKPQWQVGGMP